MEHLSLNGKWSVICHMPDDTSFEMEGNTPGCSINDLINAGKLPSDVFWRDNADAVQAYERSSFEYSRIFDIAVQPGKQYILKFSRLDTYCHIYLNGELLAHCMDEHISHAFDVTALLKNGENTLNLHFDSSVVIGESMPDHPGAFTTERLNTRRTQCTYGWDWVARFVGCGISGEAGIDQGRRSAYEGIAPVIYRMDPHREFLPSSPYGGKMYASNTQGTTHNTQFPGDSILPYMLSGNCADYRKAWKYFRARFIAEEPHLGAVTEGTLRKFMTDEDIFGKDDSMWRSHTKSNPALPTHLFDISLSFAESILGAFSSPADKAFKLRYLQYEWIRFTMEQLRREMWLQSGIIYWMYNDCWPAASGWALVDYYNKPKDAWYAFRRCAKRSCSPWTMKTESTFFTFPTRVKKSKMPKSAP